MTAGVLGENAGAVAEKPLFVIAAVTAVDDGVGVELLAFEFSKLGLMLLGGAVPGVVSAAHVDPVETALVLAELGVVLAELLLVVAPLIGDELLLLLLFDRDEDKLLFCKVSLMELF